MDKHKRYLFIGLALSLVAACLAMLAFAVRADAADRRPCVSSREFHSITESYVRADLEQRWDVRGLGTPVELPGIEDKVVIIYPKCGDVKNFPDRFYGVGYYFWHGHQWAGDLIWDYRP